MTQLTENQRRLIEAATLTENGHIEDNFKSPAVKKIVIDSMLNKGLVEETDGTYRITNKARELVGAKIPEPAPIKKPSKKSMLLEMLQGEGAALKIIMEKTGWQSHSVRGMLSNLKRKEGYNIQSRKTDTGERVYFIE